MSLKQPSRRQSVATILGCLFSWLFGSKGRAAERKKRTANWIDCGHRKTVVHGQGNAKVPGTLLNQRKVTTGTFRDWQEKTVANLRVRPDNNEMPRTARADLGGYSYHALNRGNSRAAVFHAPDDYHGFVRLLRQACARLPMPWIGFCLMPRHFQLVLWPSADDPRGPCMQWLRTAHVHGYRKRYRGSGQVWQGRFRAFAIEQDEYLLTVLRYVQRKPLPAGLVERAEAWPWSSLPLWFQRPLWPWQDIGPVPRPPGWLEHVQAAQTEAELAAVRHSVQRGCPFGSGAWVEGTAAQLGLESSVRPGGRPRQAGRPRAEQRGLFGEKEP